MMMFLSQTLRFPKFTGAIAPSSKGLADLITKKSNLENCRVVVEVGPGTGVFTSKIMTRMDPSASYIGIEINEKFVEELGRTMPQAKIFNDSAENIVEILERCNLTGCDRIISGLPWTVFSGQLQDRLIKKFLSVLSPGGLFTTFSYYPLNHLPNGRSFRDKLNRNFSEVRRTKVVSNVPPAFVYVCKK